MKKLLIFFLLSHINLFSQKRVIIDVLDAGNSHKPVAINLKLQFKYTSSKTKKSQEISSTFNSITKEFGVNVPNSFAGKSVSITCKSCDDKGFLLQTENIKFPDFVKSRNVKKIAIDVQSNVDFTYLLQRRIAKQEYEIEKAQKEKKRLLDSNNKLREESNNINRQLIGANREIGRLIEEVKNNKLSIAQFEVRYNSLAEIVDDLQKGTDIFKERLQATIDEIKKNEEYIYYASMKMINCHCKSYDPLKNELMFSYNLVHSINDQPSYLILAENVPLKIGVKWSWKRNQKILDNESTNPNKNSKIVLDGSPLNFTFKSKLLKEKKSVYDIEFFNSQNFSIGKLNLKSLREDCDSMEVERAIFNERPLIVDKKIEVNNRTLVLKLLDKYVDGNVVNIYLKDYKSEIIEKVAMNEVLKSTESSFKIPLTFKESILIIELVKDPGNDGISGQININGKESPFIIEQKNKDRPKGIKIKVTTEGWYLD